MSNQYQDFGDDAESDTGDFNPTAGDSDDEGPKLHNGDDISDVKNIDTRSPQAYSDIDEKRSQRTEEKSYINDLEAQEDANGEQDQDDGDAAGEDDEGPGEDLNDDDDDDDDEEDEDGEEDAVCDLCPLESHAH